MTPAQWDDVHRRVSIARQRKESPRRCHHAHTYPSAMSRAVAAGLMVPVHPEQPRCLCWYRLTDAGWIEYRKRFTGQPSWFSKQYARLVFAA